MMLEEGMLLGERYEIIKKIGAGGMSIVYLAKCHRLQRHVAVKVLKAEFVTDEAFVKKFRAEAFSSASLSHSNVVSIYDVGVEGEIYYIVMEYVEGPTLKELIASKGPLSSEMAIQYSMQIVSALKHAHKKQIIHRDIKPQNIIITSEDVVKVADFGIARAVDSSTIVATGNAIGSVHYFSPEQARGAYINETSDLYSCGIVMFEMVTGHLPFEGESHVSVALKHINEDLPRPSELMPTISVGVEQVILKAANKKQELRYQNADEMLEDMKKALTYPEIPVSEPDDEMEHTVFLSSEDMEYLRQSEKGVPDELLGTPKIEVQQVEEEPYKELIEEEDDDVPFIYRLLVSLGGILVTLIILAGVAVMAFFSVPSLFEPKEVEVPNLVGKTLEEANIAVQGTSLKITKIAEVETNDAMEGSILEQSPKKESIVETETVISVTVAKPIPVEMIDVPDIIGMDNAEAQNIINELGLEVWPERAYSPTVEMGRVMDQSPRAGESIEEGSIVTIVLSRGPEVSYAQVPNLRGMTEAAARTAISNAGLRTGNVTEREDEIAQVGTVIEQSVMAGGELERGSVVNFVISIEPEEEEVLAEEDLLEDLLEDGTLGDETLEENTDGETPGSNESEEDELEEESNESVNQVATITHTVNDPGLGEEEYHVRLILETDTEVVQVFDQVVKQEQFPVSVQITGKGTGILTTYFGGKEQYKDRIEFNGVTE